MIIDGKNAILGRLSSHIAKQLLSGKEIVIVNSADIIITGDPKQIVGKYLQRRRRGSPQHGPFFPKKPDLIVRRTIRGMLPKTKKGRAAFKKLRVYISVPDDLRREKMEKIAVKNVKINSIPLRELAKSLGWKE